MSSAQLTLPSEPSTTSSLEAYGIASWSPRISSLSFGHRGLRCVLVLDPGKEEWSDKFEQDWIMVTSRFRQSVIVCLSRRYRYLFIYDVRSWIIVRVWFDWGNILGHWWLFYSYRPAMGVVCADEVGLWEAANGEPFKVISRIML